MALQTPYNQHSLHESSEKHRNASLALRSHVFKSSNSASEEPVIPRPEIFDQLLKPAPQNFVSPIQIPNASECAVHLKLLHALYELRQNVLHSKSLDDAFDIKPNIRTVWRGYPRRQVKIKDSMFAKKREEKWPIYVKFAVLRFLHWVKKADSALYEAELLGKVEEIGLPPLDILLVWHSCLLNPRDFSVFCREHSYRHIRNVEFPWSKIHHSIDSAKSTFTFSDNGARSFKKFTNLEPNLYHFLSNSSKSQISRSILTECSSPELSFNEITAYIKSSSHHPLGSYAYFRECFRKTGDLEATVEQITSAIHRQSAFIDKMHRFLWLRSPAVSGTLERAVDRYSKFVKLFKVYPKKMLVPTLDIDLVWHTHQCSALRYQKDIESYTGRFIDHNDKLGSNVLGDGMEETRDLYRIRFGKEYSICLCWDCEATLSAGEKLKLGLAGHESSVKRCAELVSMQVTFYRVVEDARRADKPLPVWDEPTYGTEYWFLQT